MFIHQKMYFVNEKGRVSLVLSGMVIVALIRLVMEINGSVYAQLHTFMRTVFTQCTIPIDPRTVSVGVCWSSEGYSQAWQGNV